MSDGQARLIYGTDEVPPPLRRLIAGPLSALLDGGNLRTIQFGDTEIIRGISFLVRTATWGTLAPELRDLRIAESGQGFTVTYSARVQDGLNSLSYVAQICGRAAGSLEFSCEVIADTRFETARVGFVVLHPISGVAGRPVRIEEVNGSIVEGRFPQLIDPVQPMRNLRALTHEPVEGLTVTCRLEGDTFEMEDQRNWTDASFKTYSRPLSLPWPYSLSAGECVNQTVTVTCDGALPPGGGVEPRIQVQTGAVLGVMPPIGLGCTPEEAAAALPMVSDLRAAGVSLLVCRFDPRQGHGQAALARYRALAEGLGATVELQVVVPSLDDFAADLTAAAKAVADAGLVLDAVMVVPAADLMSTPPGSTWPPSPPLDAVYRAARSAFPGIRLGGGMFTHFTELNRKRPPPELIDFVTFATSAIVHAADDRAVMETIEALPDVAASARALAGSVPFVVGPSAIGLRDNANGPGPLPNPDEVRLPMAGRDPRQRGLFNAAWTLGYLSAFARGGAARIAVSAPVGDFGILDGQGVWPVFRVLPVCAALRGGEICALHGVEGTKLAGLLVRQGRVSHLLLANLGPDKLTVILPGEFVGGRITVLDVASLQNGTVSAETVAPGELTLDSYAVVRLRAE